MTITAQVPMTQSIWGEIVAPSTEMEETSLPVK